MDLNNLIKFNPISAKLRMIIHVASGAALVAFVWWIVWMVGELGDRKEQISLLESNVETLIKNTDTLRQNYLTCQSANVTNNETIQSLLDERADAAAAIKILSEQKKKDDWYIDRLEARIAAAKIDSSQNGPLAPVLRETIRDIQEGNK